MSVPKEIIREKAAEVLQNIHAGDENCDGYCGLNIDEVEKALLSVREEAIRECAEEVEKLSVLRECMNSRKVSEALMALIKK